MMSIYKSKFRPEETEIYKVANFTDYLNIEIPISKLGTGKHFNYEYINRLARSLGETIISKVYGPWNYYKMAAEHLKYFNVELVNTHFYSDFKHRKDITDTQMTTDILDTLYNNPDINLYIIVSGDLDFKPALMKIKNEKEKKVIIISDKFSLNYRLKKIADKVLSYQDLVKMFEL